MYTPHIHTMYTRYLYRTAIIATSCIFEINHLDNNILYRTNTIAGFHASHYTCTLNTVYDCLRLGNLQAEQLFENTLAQNTACDRVL